MRKAIVFVAASCLTLNLLAAAPVRPAAPEAASAQQVKLPPGASEAWWSTVQADLQRREYDLAWADRTPLTAQGGAWQAANRAQGFTAFFAGRGVRLARLEGEKAAWEWGVTLAEPTADPSLGASLQENPQGRLGRPTGAARVEGNRIEFDRGWVTEWFVNSPEGLEQGFTIPAPLDSSTQHSALSTQHFLFLDLSLSGSLHPVFSEDGQSVDFYAAGSTMAVLRYASLKVTDATGRELPARFEGVAALAADGRPFPRGLFATESSGQARTADGGGIRILVDDAGAVYPVTVDPLATSPAWTATGGGGNYLGLQMAAAGDLNGDGYSDALVRNGNVVELYPGGASGLATLPTWYTDATNSGVAGAGDINGDGYSDFFLLGDPLQIFYGGPNGLNKVQGPGSPESTVSSFGTAAAGVGDVNGDGYSDVMVGAYKFGATGPGFDNGFGKVYLYLGSSAGLGLTPVWSVTGDALRDLLGYAVASAGDVNGDGYADVLVGGKGYQTRYGQVRLYLGGPSGLAATAAWTVTATVFDNGLGTALSAAGDVNGDGYADVLTGTPADNSSTGRVDLYLGGASGPSATPARTYLGEAAGDQFGSALATAGDVDGDGYADVAVGAQGNASNTGKVYLYRGSSSGLGASASWTALGEKSGDYYGAVLAGGGDANGDGFCDLMTSSPPFLANPAYPTVHNGRAYLYLGGPSGLPATAGWTGSGEATSSYYGTAVASAGDVNGDGYADVVVGAYFLSGATGKAYLYLGGPSGLAATTSWTAVGEASGNYFGISVAGAGDVNGDGYADVVIGARNYGPGTSYYLGKVYLYLGSASGLSATPLWTATGETTYSYLGVSVAGAGDVNGDGYADVVVGAYGYLGSTGRAYLYLGHGGGLSSSPVWTATGEVSGDSFGYNVAGAGDVNGDGLSDVVVGAYMYSGQAGKAYLYLGSASGLASSPAWAQAGAAGVRFGSSVAAAGDVNGDSYADLLVGACYFNSRAGRAYLYLGGASGLATSAAWTADGEASSLFGLAAAPAGDVNGDGFSDVAVGAQGNGSVLGKAYLYLGSAAGLAATAAWTGSGAATADRFGAAVAAGDFNGDGSSDLLVGAPYNTTSTGRVYLYGGNGGACLSLVPRQFRADGTTPIGPLGLAFDQQARLGARLRSPFGRGSAKLEWQAVPLHGSLSPALNPVQSLSRWYAFGLAGTARAELVDLSEATGPWTWRLRVRYNPATLPLMPHSRWLTLDTNGARETDLQSVMTAPPPPCVAPDEPCWLYSVVKSGTDYTLNWQDPNQADQRTGWNIRRSSDPAVTPKSSWPLVGSNVVDMDAGSANYQWTDHSAADPGAGGVWYYEVTTYNASCPAEGPF